VRYPRHFGIDDGLVFGFGGHLRFEFVLYRGSLLTKVVAKEIFLPIGMQPYNNGVRVTRML
jgi:hypothetical protein